MKACERTIAESEKGRRVQDGGGQLPQCTAWAEKESGSVKGEVEVLYAEQGCALQRPQRSSKAKPCRR